MGAVPQINRVFLLTLVLTTGCSNSPVGSESTSSTTAQSESSVEPSSGSGSTSAPDVPLCPDGVVSQGEACDDGNTINGDGCNTDCSISATLLWEFVSGPDDDAGIYDVVHDLVVAADGSIVVGGARNGAGVGPRWVAKFSPELSPVWSNFYGDGGNDIVTGVAVASDAIYAVGAVGEPSKHDIWVSRIDLEGVLVWERTAGDSADDYATEVVFSDDGLIVAGILSSEGSTPLWLGQYSADGQPGWTATVETGSNAKLFPLGPGLGLAPEAAVVAFRKRIDGVGYTLISAHSRSDGAALWSPALPMGGLLGVSSAPGGDLVTVGERDDALVVQRVTGDGDISWTSETCIGEAGREIAVDSQGDVVVIGDGPSAAGRNIRLCKFSAEGELRWGKDIDGSGGDDLGYTVAIGPGDRIVAGGVKFAAASGNDAWVAVFSP